MMRSARAIEIAALLLLVAGAAIPGSVLLPAVAAPQVAAASATDWSMLGTRAPRRSSAAPMPPTCARPGPSRPVA